jgi:hypothetical protein
MPRIFGHKPAMRWALTTISSTTMQIFADRDRIQTYKMLISISPPDIPS